ncbi:2Fe-2S iron-sulfur cluster-binding protein [Candidatus Cyanaurora vandensis]|uniref:2Fe-2S iron-sulfur cluster-binding protein n=1 Tax=Candidatus Cyanaurora vandensis TaxID=2714958 RepID=UPI00257EAC5C|nr:2Fe-2S iron-sulfur cluster-binding protein [Candidatus Cyanaurora vandensis]
MKREDNAVTVNLYFEDTSKTITVESGRRFMEICDEYDSPVFFGCRAASCATCLVEITAGLENLTPITPDEEVLLSILAEGNPKARLACQCVVNGSIAVKVLAPS